MPTPTSLSSRLDARPSSAAAPAIPVTSSSSRPSTSTPTRCGRRTSQTRASPSRTTPSRVLRRAAHRRDGPTRPHVPTGLGLFYREMIQRSRRWSRSSVVQALRETHAERAHLVPARRVGAGGASSTHSARSTRASRSWRRAPGVHRAAAPRVGKEARRARACRSWATTSSRRSARRIQRTACSPSCIRRPGRGGFRPHVPAEASAATWTSWNMLERRSPDLEEDLQDQLGAVPARPAAAQGEHPHRPERPRAVARAQSQWPIIRLEGAQLRRRAPEHRDEARGLGLPELGRRE